MAANLNKIKHLPKYAQIIIGAVLPILLIVAFYFLFFQPKSKEIATLTVKVVKLDQEIATSQAMVNRLNELIAENAILTAKLDKLKQQLPEEKEVSGLLKQVSELGLQSGLEILLWKPESRRTDPAGLYVEIPVKVQVQTEYHQLGDFLSQVSRLPRLVNISNMDLRNKAVRDKETNERITADFTARTFASASQADRAAAAEAKGKKRK